MSTACVNGATEDTYVSVAELAKSNRWYNRLNELREFYVVQFGSQPKFFVRVPGRVNIIGEHVDYCGYPVLPMAIDQCILLAVGYSEEDSLLNLRNIDRKFENYKCDLNSIRTELPQSGGPAWYKYFLCGVKGIYETIEGDFRPIGMSVALCGNIPPASGLSSSSALVSSATLATAFVHHKPLNRKFLASISAGCERYIGTQGGGMDQAIAYLGKAGCAQFIEFHPELKATPIQLPQGACFVVANSLAEINKAASSDYNQRVVECRLGCRLMAKQKSFKNWREITRFAQLQSDLSCDLSELEALALKYLSKELYTREDLIEELGVLADEFDAEFLTANTREMTHFKLRQRALHVIQESMRVTKFRAICEALSCGAIGNGNGIDENSANGIKVTSANGDTKDAICPISMLSKLMCQSHDSLRNLYECSHPDLDRLIDISQEAGVGGRLTGAGWGGCIVALCDSMESSSKYIQVLKEKYFDALEPNAINKKQCSLDEVVFASFPCNGAEIFLAERH